MFFYLVYLSFSEVRPRIYFILQGPACSRPGFLKLAYLPGLNALYLFLLLDSYALLLFSFTGLIAFLLIILPSFNPWPFGFRNPRLFRGLGPLFMPSGRNYYSSVGPGGGASPLIQMRGCENNQLGLCGLFGAPTKQITEDRQTGIPGIPSTPPHGVCLFLTHSA